jgi:hypothetical protein
MDLMTAINLVVADTREAEGRDDMPAAEALATTRELPLEEIDEWVEDLDHITPELEEAYRLVIQARDVDITAALAQ